MVGEGQIANNSYTKRFLCRFYLASQHGRGALLKFWLLFLCISSCNALTLIHVGRVFGNEVAKTSYLWLLQLTRLFFSSNNQVIQQLSTVLPEKIQKIEVTSHCRILPKALQKQQWKNEAWAWHESTFTNV